MSDLAALPRADAPAAAPAPRFLADVYDAACLCNKCSLCQATCPTYAVNPVEWETARGRVSLVRDAIEGRLELRDIAEGPLSTCLTCNNCVAACAPGVPTADIVTRARMELHEQEGHPPGQTAAFRTVLNSPALLRLAHATARLAQVTGLRGLALRTGMHRWIGVAGDISAHVGPLPRRTAYRRARDLPRATRPVRGRLVFLTCCYENMAVPEAAEATMRLLLAEGYELVVPTLACSGLPAKTGGDRQAMLDLARSTLDRLGTVEGEVDGYVGSSASCTGHVQRYGEILAGDVLSATTAAVVARDTWQVSRLLAEQGMRSSLGRLRWRVAYDEPCSLPLDSAARRAPYTLLERVPGLELCHLEEAAMCCGGPGTYFRDEPERSTAILKRKFDNVLASGAEVLATENVSCLVQLREGARRFAPQVRVMHLSEVLLASLEVERRRLAAAG